MSYILEALRRSQAERERGRVPGIDAQPAPAEPATDARRGLPLTWVASALGVLLLLVAAVAVTWWSGPPTRAAASDGAGAAAARPPEAPAAPLPPPATTVLPQVVSAPPQVAAPPQVVAPPQVAAPPQVVAPSQVSAPPQVIASPPPPPPKAAAAPRSVPIAELSPEQRRELPNMVIGGSIWSDSAASRFVIVNGQVVREGEAAAPGVTVERIAPRAATLRWRDLRIDVPL